RSRAWTRLLGVRPRAGTRRWHWRWRHQFSVLSCQFSGRRTRYRTSSGCWSLKVSADSAGSTMSLLPLNAAPVVPAPPPARAPMAAPLPPPARPPISAPTPAPPPAITAVRLPFPLAERTREEVSTGRSEPLTLMEISLSCSTAPPLKRPSGLASTTVPEALAPEGITVLPSTSTGLATVAEKLWPGWLILDPTDSPSLTVIMVPVGTTTGFTVSAFGWAFVAAFGSDDSGALDSGGLLQPSATMMR